MLPDWDDLFRSEGTPPSKRHRLAGDSTISHRETFDNGLVSFSRAVELANWPVTTGGVLGHPDSPLVRKTDA